LCIYIFTLSQEIKSKIKLRQNLLNTLKKEQDPYIKSEWVPAGPLIPCNGCGNMNGCGFCSYQKATEKLNQKDKNYSDKVNKVILKQAGYEKMKPEDWDQDYVTKFGMLQKANILYSFRRYIDSLEVIEQAKKLVIEDQKKIDERYIDLDKKWRAKLQIKNEIPKEALQFEINQEVVDYFKITIPVTTLLIYAEKMRKGNNFSIYNRNTYLNKQILLFHELVTKTLNKYNTDIKALKRQISELTTWTYEKKEKISKENPKLYKKFSIKYRTEMCKDHKLGICKFSYRDCKYAHSSHVLNLTETRTQKQLLKNNMKVTEHKLKESKTIVPWTPAKSGFIEKEKVFSKRSYSRNKRSNSEKRDRSHEINRYRIQFHEY
jgi:tetratricopeptide (TPR) repeat protein